MKLTDGGQPDRLLGELGGTGGHETKPNKVRRVEVIQYGVIVVAQCIA